MWNDFVIGEGDKLNSAWAAYEVPDGPSISHNGVSYWIKDCVLGIGMTIMKDTEEGMELARLLESPEPEAVSLWLATLVFRHCDPQVLVQRIETAQKEAFRAGQTAKAQELRVCLGLGDGRRATR